MTKVLENLAEQMAQIAAKQHDKGFMFALDYLEDRIRELDDRDWANEVGYLKVLGLISDMRTTMKKLRK